MSKTVCLLLIAICLANYVKCQEGSNNNKDEALKFLKEWNLKAQESTHLLALKMWAFQTNITDFNQQEQVKQQTIHAHFQKDMQSNALVFNSSAMPPDIQRKLKKMKDIGTAAQPDHAKVEELTKILAELETIYSTASFELSNDKSISMQTGLPKLFATSRDYDELVTLWSGWRNASGRQMRDLYTQYVKLSNEATTFLGYKDYGEYWRSAYESDTFVSDIQTLFQQVKPLYEQLHAFVRKRLKNVYGADKFPESGHIPAHLFGDIWAQMWTSILDIVTPFPNKPTLDVTKEMIKQNYSVNKLLLTAEDFFSSLGFEQMVPSFWTKSMFEKPDDGRKVVCQASAWDMYGQDDYRIKMCVTITHQELMLVHHEMGHIQNYMQYNKQPVVYRAAANPAFHEALGDALALSVQTPEHMKKLGFIPNVLKDKETDINFLLSMALQKIAFLPFGYIIDFWRWDVFSGKTTPETYNKEWWALRCRDQGVSPPIPRSEADFDPGSKYHVPGNAPYIMYFLSFIVQFQFHKGLCEAAGNTKPLHRCDIYRKKEAGSKLMKMLKLGSSKPWPVALKQLTGQETIDAGPLLEYFQPLMDYLKEQNGNDVGWKDDCPVPT